MKRRIFAFTLTLCMSFSLLPMASLAYQDVPPSHKAYDAIEYVSGEGLMNGVGDDKFAPEASFTRAMFVTVLGRMDGVDTSRYTGSDFRDVTPSDWYAPYVKWASQKGLVTGYGNGIFGPNDNITREQCAAIFYRWLDGAGQCSRNSFTTVFLADSEKISPYAAPGVFYMTSRNIMTPDSADNFKPRNVLTRGDLAMALCELDRSLTKGSVSKSISQDTATSRIQAYFNAGWSNKGYDIGLDGYEDGNYSYSMIYYSASGSGSPADDWSASNVGEVRVNTDNGMVEVCWFDKGEDWQYLTCVN